MTSTIFPRPNGVRSGVGIKPPRVPTLLLAGANPVISVGAFDVCRVLFAASVTGSARMRFGASDGQRVTLVCSGNPVAAKLQNAPASQVQLDTAQLVDDWVPQIGDAISLVWDDRSALWLETSRAYNG